MLYDQLFDHHSLSRTWHGGLQELLGFASSCLHNDPAQSTVTIEVLKYLNSATSSIRQYPVSQLFILGSTWAQHNTVTAGVTRVTSWDRYKCSIWFLHQIHTACKQTAMLA
jgi:hypothetical protein